MVVFGILTPHEFLTMDTLHFVASQQAIFGIIAIATLVPIVAGQYDLSVGANANLSGIAAIIAQTNWHWPVMAAILFAIAIGFLTGLVNGILVIGFGLNSFIATLAMGSVLAAVQIILSGSVQPAPGTSSFWNNLTQLSVGGFQIVVLYLLVLALVVWWFLELTPAGRYMHAVGGNSESARLSGVPVDRMILTSLLLSGGIAGFGGVLYTSLTGPSLSFGGTLLLPAFAAVFLGSTQLRPGRFNVWGTVIAIYVLATGVEGLELVSGAQWLGDMFNGAALIVAVALAVRREHGNATKLRALLTRRRPRHLSPPAVPSEVEAATEALPSAPVTTSINHSELS